MKLINGVILTAVLIAAPALGQDPAPSLQDLVGVKGAAGESALEERGYTWIRTEKSGGDAYSYWRENENGQCVGVRTSDGRYASIVFVPYSDCKGTVAAAAKAESSGVKGEFATVCGVIVEGKTYRYRCTATDVRRGSEKIETVLRYPDQTIRLKWKSGDHVVLNFEGMVPKEATYATAEGETNFVFEGKTYFYISNEDLARREIEDFQD